MTSSIQDEQTHSWIQCLQFLDSLEFKDDLYLVTIPEPWKRTILLSVFSQSLRKASFSASAFTYLAEGTVRATVDHVAQAFRHGQRTYPCLDNDGKLSILILQQYCGYRNLEKNVKHQELGRGETYFRNSIPTAKNILLFFRSISLAVDLNFPPF